MLNIFRGAGMTELCSHISTIDFVVVSGKKSILEYTDHLHGMPAQVLDTSQANLSAEAFVNPASMAPGSYHTSPTAPGYSTDVKEEYFDKFECPQGSFWKSPKGLEMLNDPWRGVLGEQTS